MAIFEFQCYMLATVVPLIQLDLLLTPLMALDVGGRIEIFTSDFNRSLQLPVLAVSGNSQDKRRDNKPSVRRVFVLEHETG